MEDIKFQTYPKIKQALLFVAILLPLSGCYPTTVELFRPEATGGRVVGAHCPPLKSFILFERNDVIVGVRALESPIGQVSITVTFEVPQNTTVALKEQTIAVILDGKDFSTNALTGRHWISAAHTAKLPENSPMVGKTKKSWFFDQITLYGTTEHAYFFFKATLDIKDPDVFEIRLPTLQINGVEVKIPVIKFKRDSKFYIAPFNC